MEKNLDTNALADTIKLMIENMLNNWDLTDYAAGTVININPLRVRLHERLILEEKDLVLTTNVMDQKVPVSNFCPEHGEESGFIMDAVAPGDKLIMLKAARGQTYVVIGKAVS
ncbi:MAG: DUF2577 family protein [Bacillota bacterium]|jgi:hypothetical protein